MHCYGRAAKDGEIGNIRENLKDFIHLGQLLRLFGM